MISLINDNSMKVKGAKPLTKIIKSLSKKRALPSEKNKKNRHSLKLLCFHPPSTTSLPILIDLFKEEFKSKTDYFNLLCYHLISHAPLMKASPQTSEIVQSIGNLITAFSKKPNKRLFLFYRVLFHLCFFCPDQYNYLVQINEKILTLNVDTSKESLKPYGDLISECLFLLVDLPNFEITATDLLTRPPVVTALLNIYRSTTETRNKLNILNFLSRVSFESYRLDVAPQSPKLKIPTDFFNILEQKDPILDSAIPSNFLIYNYDKFLPHISALLQKKVVSSTRLIQLRIIETKGPNEILLASITNQITPKESFLLPLLRLLEKIPRGAIDPNVLSTLFQVCQDKNLTVAVISFMCICFISDEIEWIKKYFEKILSGFSYTPQCSIANMILKSWISALDDSQGNKDFIIPLFKILLMKFGNCINQMIYDQFLQKAIQEKCSNAFLKVFRDCLLNLPSFESVIYILYGASQIRDFAEPDTIESFMNAAKQYMSTGGPGMKNFYSMTLDNPQTLIDLM